MSDLGSPSGEVVMRNPFAPGVGGVLSADIAVPEHARELAFYARILTTGSAPLWRDDLTNHRGTPVIGLGARTPDYEALPLQWMPHFQVADVGSSAARALELGGSERMHGRNEDGESQWAVLVDPWGAAFGLIPVVDVNSLAADPMEDVGRISWLTLVVPDVATTCRFYERVIGWSSTSAAGDDAVEMRRPDGVAAAEIRRVGGDDAGIPPVWILSLPVGDLAESLRRVREEGGEVLDGSTETGRAILRDPVGVYFALESRSATEVPT
ncbi:MAG: VOC family protein [Thermoanaerobaculia bacterium]